MLRKQFKVVEDPSGYSGRCDNVIIVIAGALIAMSLGVIMMTITTADNACETKCVYCGNYIAASDATVYTRDGKTYHVNCFREVENGKD